MARRKFPFRRSVGLTTSVAERVKRLSVVENRSFEYTLRLLIVEALRSRESRWPDASSGPAKQGFVGAEEHGQ